MNEILFFTSILIVFGLLVATSRFFGRSGLIAWCAFISILAEISVTKGVTLFGINTTLGNVTFASNFLATDILTELYGEKSAKKAVYVGIWGVVVYLIVSQLMLLYRPSSIDLADGAMQTLFGFAPRICISSVVMLFAANFLDVRLYAVLKRKTGGRLMWLRNNLCTILCNCGENFLFTAGAFWGVYEPKDILTIACSASVIEIIAALCDTPFLYLARRLGGPRAGSAVRGQAQRSAGNPGIR